MFLKVEQLVFRPDERETGWRSSFGMPQWIGITFTTDYQIQRVSFKVVANMAGDYMAPGLWVLQVSLQGHCKAGCS